MEKNKRTTAQDCPKIQNMKINARLQFGTHGDIQTQGRPFTHTRTLTQAFSSISMAKTEWLCYDKRELSNQHEASVKTGMPSK